MSQTEIHTGTLVPVKSIKTLEELKDFVTKNNITPEDYKSLDDYLAEFSNSDSIENIRCIVFVKCEDNRNRLCVYSNKQIFKFEKHEAYDDFDINSWTKDVDDKINFITVFYNGGTYFNEVLEDGLEELLGNK